MAAHSVDVLIPVYNPDPQHLAEALGSLRAQTFTEWNALICDDCSSVDVQKMIAPLLADPRIRFVRNEKRQGIGGNWNACARQTEGTYVAYLFQDDVWSPDYLQQAIRILETNPTVGFVSLEHHYDSSALPAVAPLYKAVEEFRAAKVNAGFHYGPALLRWWIEQELTPNIIGEPSFVVMRRETMEKMGPFLSDMPQFLDTEYWTRLLLACDWYFLRPSTEGEGRPERSRESGRVEGRDAQGQTRQRVDAFDGTFGSFRVHPGGASAVNQETGQGLFDRLRCFGLLLNELGGEERAAVLKARKKALRTMIGKFFGRVGSGRRVSAQGSGELRKFCMRHPFEVAGAFIEYLAKGNS